MTAFMKTIHRFEDNFDRKAEWFAFHHPCIAFIAMFVGLPLFILTTVAASTTVLALPVAWVLGWM